MPLNRYCPSHIGLFQCVLLGQGVLLIMVGLTLRVAASFFVVLGNGFTLRERILIAIAWLPKATVQVS